MIILSEGTRSLGKLSCEKTPVSTLKGAIMKDLLKYGVMVVAIAIGLLGLGGLMVVVCEPTSRSQELVNRATQRMAEQPAFVSSSQSLARLFNDK